ncbi:MAG: glycosyltransferase [Chitinophagaceae bacterium]
MTYWLLTTEYPPFFGGGIGTYCFNTAKMFAAKNNKVTVFISDSTVSSIQEKYESDNLRIVRFNPSRTNTSSFLGHLTNLSYEYAHIVKHFVEKEGKPDILETQEYMGIGYYLLQYKYLLFDWCKDIPVVVTMHSPSYLYMQYNRVPLYRYPNYWICEMERFCLVAADYVISPSQYMVDELRRNNYRISDQLSIVPNPYQPMHTSMDSADSVSGSEIVFYGKLTAQKGIFELLHYFTSMWAAGFKHPLFLIGGQDIVYHPEGVTMGDLIRKKYKSQIKSGLLILEDRIPPSALGERIRKARVVIVPSNNDNLPYVVFEMMSMGKTVLVSKQGGQSEVVKNGVDGFVFDHKEKGSFEQQLTKVLSLTEPERKRIEENAKEKVKQVAGYETIYEQKTQILHTLLRNPGKQRTFFPQNRLLENQEQISDTASDDSLLSVIVPYYNMGKYIDETISSVRSSGFSNFEILIINDGSNDENSIARLDKYRAAGDIRVLDNPNRGLAYSRNYGASQANGRYIAFLDADDMIMPGYYTTAVEVLRKYENIHFVSCWTQYFEGSAKQWPGFSPDPPLILFHNTVNSSSLVFRKESFLRAGLNDEHMPFPGLEDYTAVVSMIEKGLSGVTIPELLFHYRVRQDSMFRAVSKTKRLLLSQHIAGTHKRVYADFAGEVFNLQNANGPGILLDNPSLDYHLADKLPFAGKISLQMIKLIKKNKHIKTIAYRVHRIIKKII